MKKSDKTESKS